LRVAKLTHQHVLGFKTALPKRLLELKLTLEHALLRVHALARGLCLRRRGVLRRLRTD
jgi:hypothetical protein